MSLLSARKVSVHVSEKEKNEDIERAASEWSSKDTAEMKERIQELERIME